MADDNAIAAAAVPVLIYRLYRLLVRLAARALEILMGVARHVLDFVAPKWTTRGDPGHHHLPTLLAELWQQYLPLPDPHGNASATTATATQRLADFMLRHFDTDGDGHISSAELLANLQHALPRPPAAQALRQALLEQRPHLPYRDTWAAWLHREWPLLDWKLGVFLWRSFGGILVALAVCSVMPGRLHGISARLLKWPLLGLVYFLISVELVVYVVIRIGIAGAEYMIARPKHRRLRRQMGAARSYADWYGHAAALDRSQRRDEWLNQVDDETSYEYNWGFILELMKDLRAARTRGDSILALAVLQQCTRKNVGGIMSEDLFSYSNTGEPKTIVREFVAEVVATLDWITREAQGLAPAGGGGHGGGGLDGLSPREVRDYEQRLQREVREEKTKLLGSLMEATLQDTGGGAAADPGEDHPRNGGGDGSGAAPRGSHQSEQPQSPSVMALPAFHRNQVLVFLKRARAAYGRTAFCMSGGAMLGLYHFGVVLALLEAGCLPRIISGTSAGSVIGAIICTRTDDELRNDLQPHILADKLCCFRRPWKDRIKSVLENGCMFAFDEWMDLIQWFARGSTTFLEAYQRTGRILCITLSSTSKKSPPVLLNYLSAPNVTIASAVIASAAVPGFIPPVRLQVKLHDGTVRNQGGEKDQCFWDGSIQQDIPTQGLSEMLNCQFFIASQCNPHILPFFFNRKGGVGRPSRWSSGMQETSYRGGFLLSALEMYLKNDMKAKMAFLNQVDAAVGPISTMFSQEFQGSTTIVPTVRPMDYTKLFTDPKEEELEHYFQAGAVAAYEHIAMIKLHYSIANAIEECIARLEQPNQTRPLRSGNATPSYSLSDDWMDQRAEDAFATLKAHADNDTCS